MTGPKRLIIFLLALLTLSGVSSNFSRVYTGSGVYDSTVKRWTSAINTADFGSVSWIFASPTNGVPDKKHLNGHRDTILMVPTPSDPRNLTVIVWFHGLGGFTDKTFSKRLIPQIEKIVDQGHSVALVVPEMPWSTNTITRRGRQGKVWRKSGDLEKFMDDVLEHLSIWALVHHGVDLGNVSIVFVGHSAGGSAISSAAREGGLCRLKPTTVIWSDASYDHWLDRAWNGCLQHADTELYVLVRKWDDPHKNAQSFVRGIKSPHKDKINYHVLDRKSWTHGRIGNQALLIPDIFSGNH